MIGALCTVREGLLNGLEDLELRKRVETIQTITLLRSSRILRRVLETWGDLLLLKLLKKTISKCWFEKLLKDYHKSHNKRMQQISTEEV